EYDSPRTSSKNPLNVRQRGEFRRNESVLRFVNIGVRITTLDEGLFAQVVVAEMAGPADGVRRVRSGAVDQEGREQERVPLLGFYGQEVFVLVSFHHAKTIHDAARHEALAVAARDDFQRPQRAIDLCQGNPKDGRVERALHAS